METISLILKSSNPIQLKGAKEKLQKFFDILKVDGVEAVWHLYQTDPLTKSMVDTCIGLTNTFSAVKPEKIEIRIDHMPTQPHLLQAMLDKLQASGIIDLWNRYNTDNKVKEEIHKIIGLKIAA